MKIEVTLLAPGQNAVSKTYVGDRLEYSIHSSGALVISGVNSASNGSAEVAFAPGTWSFVQRTGT